MLKGAREGELRHILCVFVGGHVATDHFAKERPVLLYDPIEKRSITTPQKFGVASVLLTGL